MSFKLIHSNLYGIGISLRFGEVYDRILKYFFLYNLFALTRAYSKGELTERKGQNDDVGDVDCLHLAQLIGLLTSGTIPSVFQADEIAPSLPK